METAVWSVIKYKPKAGSADEFKKALELVSEIINKPDIIYSFIEFHTDQIVQITRIPSIDAIVEGQMEGDDWLESVDHLLEKDSDRSRTQAYSGLEIDVPFSFQAS